MELAGPEIAFHLIKQILSKKRDEKHCLIEIVYIGSKEKLRRVFFLRTEQLDQVRVPLQELIDFFC